MDEKIIKFMESALNNNNIHNYEYLTEREGMCGIEQKGRCFCAYIIERGNRQGVQYFNNVMDCCLRIISLLCDEKTKMRVLYEFVSNVYSLEYGNQ